MSPANFAKKTVPASRWGWCLLLVAMLVTCGIYSLGLSGSFLFDDYPNIIDNHAVQPSSASIANLVRAALSSTSSEFKRPLASLSFAANYLASGLNPYWMKLTNLIIHLLNGLLIYLLARSLLRTTAENAVVRSGTGDFQALPPAAAYTNHAGVVAALIAASWMMLPINLTGVLYVVQRMESMANVFVLLGLIGYTSARRRMQNNALSLNSLKFGSSRWKGVLDRDFVFCLVSITVPAILGILAKETAVMLPLYALLIEWALFRFTSSNHLKRLPAAKCTNDPRIAGMFVLVLMLPMALGLAWLLPGILKPQTWAVRDFTLKTRLLSEARIVADYVSWTILPSPHALSFYHDDFRISTGLLKPWTTLASIICLAFFITAAVWLRQRRPLVALGLALFLGCQLLTATIIPLELIYEHRNYFASFGLMLALIPVLAAPQGRPSIPAFLAGRTPALPAHIDSPEETEGSLPMALPRYVLLAGLFFGWAALTAMTAYVWGNPLRLAEDLAIRAPLSPRAQYELGRTYIIYSHYDPSSPFTKLAYAPLEKATKLPDSSILAEQALIFMNAHMHLPLKDTWWQSMITKLKTRKPTVQDESSLGALTKCANEHSCQLPEFDMVGAFTAALSHPNPSARLLAFYGDYAWNSLEDRVLGLRMTNLAVEAAPREPAYQITLIRMLAADKKFDQAASALKKLERLNYGGQLNDSIQSLQTQVRTH